MSLCCYKRRTKEELNLKHYKTKMDRQEMIDKIYEEIAIKETIEIEGCQAYSDDCGKKDSDGFFICPHRRRWRGPDREEIKLLPVMIGDVLNWMEQQNPIEKYCNIENLSYIMSIREEKRKPIELQSDECIEYVYNLITNNN